MLRGALVASWSMRQKAISLSSWESELYAAVGASTRGLGLIHDFESIGAHGHLNLHVDSQRVIDHARRKGHSTASKHVGVRGLWLQEALAGRKLDLLKVHTSVNPADVGTTALAWKVMAPLLALVGAHVCATVCPSPASDQAWSRQHIVSSLPRVLEPNAEPERS